ncbi:MAG: DegV family protein [Clostridia bacterium]|nr:DegV family protein [Clostridia bacterium]
MKDYVIFTDSSCDLSDEMLKQRGVRSLPLSFRFENDREYKNGEMSAREFYHRMRTGEVAKTSAINPEAFALEFEKALKQGKDILYLGFSSGLSNTYNSARIATDLLYDKYPHQKILSVDTLAASAGIAMLIDIVIEKKKQGASILEAKEYAEKIKHKICHRFTVDDLVYLTRGGRINPATAFFGNMLGIKPVLYVDKRGMLINGQKVRGRKTAINTLAKQGDENIDRALSNLAYISHADCLRDANELKRILNDNYGINARLITDVGPVIGAHSGPGTLALFFIGKER